VNPEAVFLAGYSLVLVAVAAGLASLGRRSTDPWSSRVLAASRPPEASDLDLDRDLDAARPDDWPHSEVPGFHLGVSGVALAAALLLTFVSVVRHHRPLELVVQLAVLVLITLRMARAAAAFRHRRRSLHP
jgi:hypothetical protein